MGSSQMISAIAEFALDLLESELLNQHFSVWVQMCFATSKEFGRVVEASNMGTPLSKICIFWYNRNVLKKSVQMLISWTELTTVF